MALAQLITPEVAEMLRTGNYSGFRALSEELHPADMAEIMESVPEERLLVAFLAIGRDRQPEVFEYLDAEMQTRLLNEFRPEVLARLLNDLSDDARTELLVELPGSVTRRLLETLNPDERKQALALLGYPENSAGRLMTPEFLHVNADATAADVLDKVRRFADEVETVYVIYVIDASGILLGTVSLRDVVIAKPDDKVSELMTETVAAVETHDDREHALEVLREYDLLALPVVDQHRRLVGILTFDDLSDVQEDEATEDILKMHGVVAERDQYFDASVWTKYRARIVWLLGLMLVGMASVLVQQEFNHVIGMFPLLAIYITLLAATSGNVGTQSAGILIRAIVTDQTDNRKLVRIFLSEVGIGIMVALTLAATATAMVFLRGADADTLSGLDLPDVAMVLGLSMIAAVITTNTLGALIPLVMKKFRIDPAITAGPFITTAADILTILIYFSVAQALVLS